MARQDPIKDSCLLALLVGASLLAGLSYLVTEAVRWIA